MRVKINRKEMLSAIVDSGMNNKELAAKSGISKPTISYLFHHDAKTVEVHTLHKICKALNAKPSSFIVVD